MRQLTLLFSVFFLCGVLVLSGGARADSAISAEGAADLKKQVEDSLQWRIDMTKAVGQGMSLTGTIDVTPKDSFYEIRLPGLAMEMGPKGKLDIGTVIIKATPAQPGEWQSDVTLPPTMTFYDATNTPIVSVDIGRQHATGIWVPATEMYPKFDSLYQDIRIKSMGEKAVSATIASLKSTVDMKDNGDGTWKGPVDFEASGIRMDIPATAAPQGNAMQLAIAKVSSRNTYDRMDMSQALAIKKAFHDAFKARPQMGEKEAVEILKSLMPKMPAAMGDASMTFDISGFSFRETGVQPPQEPKEFSFDKLSFAGGVSGMQQEKGKIAFKTGFNGLRISSVPADYAGLVPNTFNAEALMENLPVKKIMETLFGALHDSIGADAAPETSAQTAMTTAAAAVPQMLQEAGAVLTVQNTFLKSLDLDSALAGKLEAYTASPLGAVGKMTLSVKGMDETIKKLQALSMKGGADPAMMSYAGGLTVIQMLGQASVAADGRSLRNYVFEMAPDGKILLNGADIKLVAQGLGGLRGGPPAGQDTMPAPAPEIQPAP